MGSRLAGGAQEVSDSSDTKVETRGMQKERNPALGGI